MKKTSFIFYLLSFILLSACTFQDKPRGYIFPADIENEIGSIKTTAQLEEKLGSPQTKTIYGKPVWIYYGTTENYHGPFPLSYDEKTVLLAAVSGGNVINTKILHDKDLPDVDIDSDETAIPAAIELNAIQELFNNVGRFSPAGLGQ